jgi:hypothetical protein
MRRAFEIGPGPDLILAASSTLVVLQFRIARPMHSVRLTSAGYQRSS